MRLRLGWGRSGRGPASQRFRHGSFKVFHFRQRKIRGLDDGEDMKMMKEKFAGMVGGSISKCQANGLRLRHPALAPVLPLSTGGFDQRSRLFSIHE